MKREEAIEIARKLYNESLFLKKDKEAMVTLIPELAESEDERIRKAIIRGMYALKDQKKTCFASIPIDDVIAYLEKQGKQNEIIDRNEFVQSVLVVTAITLITWIDCNTAEGNTYLSNMECKDIKNSLVNCNWNKIYAYMKNKLEKQGEQKPDDKIEPKFHEEDWVILTAGVLSITLQIVKVDTNKKLYWFNDNSYLSIVDEDCLHHWTIKDAKDGDVLAASDDSVFLYAGSTDRHAKFYAALTKCGTLNLEGGNWEDKNSAHPATKEQRNTLMKAMADAGYTFDFEKKKLKEIEQKPTDKEMKETLRTEYEKGRADIIAEMQKPAWSEEDETKIKSIIAFLKSPSLCAMDGNKGIIDESIKYLNSLKDKVQPQPKQEWSKEDEEIIINIGEYLNCYGNYIADKNEEKAAKIYKSADWLKSLKERYTWKPSDEQLNALHDAAVYVDKSMFPYPKGILVKLYEQLKKLREE